MSLLTAVQKEIERCRAQTTTAHNNGQKRRLRKRIIKLERWVERIKNNVRP